MTMTRVTLPAPIPFLLLLASYLPFLFALSPRETRPLSDTELLAVTELDPPQWTGVDSGHLAKLLVPRASGSHNNTLVQQYISSTFSSLGWHEQQTPFTSSTPIGDVEFNNLVYTFDPDAPRRLTLAAHFDSKWFPDFPANQFIGATDSAAPCAMLLDLAQALTPLLSARRSRITSGTPLLLSDLDEDEASDTTLQLIFFDGEEAFHDWTAHDSVYGARHLSELWDSTYVTPSSRHRLGSRRMDPVPTVLETMDVLVLLDLLGAKNPRIHSYWRETDWLYALMASADDKLRAMGLVDKQDSGWFGKSYLRAGLVDDDHRPFFEKGVSVLHVVANPFPRVWHTLADDASALDLPSLQRWNRILRVFVSEYLSLSPIAGENAASKRDAVGSGGRAGDELLST